MVFEGLDPLYDVQAKISVSIVCYFPSTKVYVGMAIRIYRKEGDTVEIY